MANFANLQKECSNLKAFLAAKDVKPPPSGNGVKKRRPSGKKEILKS
jgi:hypothetical protein